MLLFCFIKPPGWFCEAYEIDYSWPPALAAGWPTTPVSRLLRFACERSLTSRVYGRPSFVNDVSCWFLEPDCELPVLSSNSAPLASLSYVDAVIVLLVPVDAFKKPYVIILLSWYCLLLLSALPRRCCGTCIMVPFEL